MKIKVLKNPKQQLLLSDLFNTGDYGSWANPKISENVDWFFEQDKKLEKNSTNLKLLILKNDCQLLKKRVENLILEGANIQNICYKIANINNKEILEYALKLGSNPNIYNDKNNLPIIRAIDRKRSSVAMTLMNSTSFDFDFHFKIDSDNQKKIFSAIYKNKYNIGLLYILEKNPNLFLAKDENDNTIFHYLDSFYYNKDKIHSNYVEKILLNTIQYYKENKIYFNINEKNKFNKGISSEKIINSIITLNYEITEKELTKNNIKSKFNNKI